MLNKILLISSLTKHEAHGVSLGFESLIDGFKLTNANIKIIDTKGFLDSGNIGSFTLGRAIASFRAVILAWAAIPSRETVYITISLSQFGFIRDMLIILAARLMRKRIILHLKGGGYDIFYYQQLVLFKYLISFTLSLSTHIIVLGNLLCRQFDFITDIVDKIKIVPNGLTKDLHITTSSKILPRKNQPIRILYLSNLIPSKGYLTLLKACIKLLNHSDIKFVCDYCGAFSKTIVDGNHTDAKKLEREFIDLIKTNNLTNRVFYHGTVTGKVKEKMLSEAHIFILPTNYQWEGQPLSIIEALAYSTPVISTPHRSIPEQILEGENGFLIPPNDPDVLFKTIIKLVDDPVIYKKMSIAARVHFESNFKREVHLKKLIQIICNG